jgi:hypothetical protein
MPQYLVTLEDVTHTRHNSFAITNRRTDTIDAPTLEQAWTLACFKYYDHNPQPFTQIVDIVAGEHQSKGE